MIIGFSFYILCTCVLGCLMASGNVSRMTFDDLDIRKCPEVRVEKLNYQRTTTTFVFLKKNMASIFIHTLCEFTADEKYVINLVSGQECQNIKGGSEVKVHGSRWGTLTRFSMGGSSPPVDASHTHISSVTMADILMDLSLGRMHTAALSVVILKVLAPGTPSSLSLFPPSHPPTHPL